MPSDEVWFRFFGMLVLIANAVIAYLMARLNAGYRLMKRDLTQDRKEQIRHVEVSNDRLKAIEDVLLPPKGDRQQPPPPSQGGTP